MKRISQSSGYKASLTGLLFAIAFGAGAPAHAEKYAAIVVDSTTDRVLHASHADAPRFPASLTKVMTLYMLFDEVEAGRMSMDQVLTVSPTAAAMPPSNLRLKAGDTITVRQAIQALVTKSANDVAVVVAEAIGGTEQRFAALMTAKARSMGMVDTRFFNASGLPDDRQLSTARDMARLAEAVLEDHGEYYSYFSTRTFTWGNRTYRNHNELLGDVDGVDGIKTGYTRASGYNLMASSIRGDSRVVTVMLGGRTSRARNAHVAELIEAAYASLSAPTVNDQGIRTRTAAFETIRQPLSNANDAAVPMLNGVPFLPVAEGDAQ